MMYWWWPADATASSLPAGDSRPVLFFPPAGADQTIVTPLVPELGGLRFGVLRMPGRGVRRDDRVPTGPDLLDQVASSVAALGGPAPLVVGHSFGAGLAFAVAAELAARGQRVARLVVVAATPPHRARAARAGVPLEQHVSRRVDRLLSDGAVPPEIAAHPELGPRVREYLATDVRISCELDEPVALSTPITAVLARDDVLVEPAEGARWGDLTTGDFERVTVAGGHFFYRDTPAVLAGLLRGELAALDGAYTGL